MANRRDSRTDEQRRADDEREQEFHRKREEDGLPVLNYAGVIKLTFRDITDEEVERVHGRLVDAACEILAEKADHHSQRNAHFSGSTFTVERPLDRASSN